MFSSITMASSTTSPIARIRATGSSEGAEWPSSKCNRRTGFPREEKACSQRPQKRQTGVYSLMPGGQNRNPGQKGGYEHVSQETWHRRGIAAVARHNRDARKQR